MYAKLFSSLYQGTLRGRSNEILVFTNLLAHTSKDGTVDKHFRAIAEETGISMDEVKAAIEMLESPDPESRSPEEGGARIVRMDEHRAWGWRVVNHGKYRAIKSEEDRAEQNRLAQQRWRERNKSKHCVSSRNTDKPIQRQIHKAETETETIPPEEHTTRGKRAGFIVPDVFAKVDGFTAALGGWIESRRKQRKPPTDRAIQLVIDRLAKTPERAVEALNTAVERGWSGVDVTWLDGRTNGKPNLDSIHDKPHSTYGF